MIGNRYISWYLYFNGFQLETSYSLIQQYIPLKDSSKTTAENIMVALSLVRESNFRLKSHQSGVNPVAVFVGATQGIGLRGLELYAAHTVAPKIYILGRNEAVGARIIEDLKTRHNKDGEYIFSHAEVSLLESVDKACEEVKRRENKLDLLVMSPGALSLRGREGELLGTLHTNCACILTFQSLLETSEGLDTILALRFYARVLFLTRLLPLLQNADCPRVVSVLAAGKEGPLINGDLELKTHYSFSNSANHSSTLTSLFLEEAAARHPTVSFVHEFPGVVKTGLLTGAFPSWMKWMLEHTIIPVMTPFMVSLQEAGERLVFHATSARYPPRQVAGGSKIAGVTLSDGVEVAKGANKEAGAYLLEWNSEETEGKIMAKYREEGMRKQVWDHTYEVIGRVRGTSQGKL